MRMDALGAMASSWKTATPVQMPGGFDPVEEEDGSLSLYAGWRTGGQKGPCQPLL